MHIEDYLDLQLHERAGSAQRREDEGNLGKKQAISPLTSCREMADTVHAGLVLPAFFVD